MTSRRAVTIAATSARLAAGAVVAVGCAVGVVAAAAAPWPTVTGSAAQTTVATVPGDAVLVCTGAFNALGRDVQNASELQGVGDSRITAGGDPADPERSSIDNDDVVGGSGAEVFTAAAEGREAPLIAAAESQRLAVDDLAGLAAGSCDQATTESWIIGGSIETGAGDVLVLTNPGGVTATVTLNVFGEEQSSSSVVIPAQSQTALPFASIAAGQTEPIVRVTAEGSPVRASLQSALMSTLDPAGIDLQPSTTVAAETLIFAGIQVAALAEGNATDALRLLAVDADTQARVVVRDLDGGSASDFTAPLSAGVPLEIALSDLPLGTYSVEVTADVPLVGGVWQSSGTGAGTDFAWMTPAAPLTADTLFAVPSGPEPRLHLIGDPQQEATVALTDEGGTTREIAVAPGASALVDLPGPGVYRLSSDAAVTAAVTLSASGQLAGWPVAPGPSEQDSVTVLP
ncbi:DUF5719 family protein [Microbacterium tumbae]